MPNLFSNKIKPDIENKKIPKTIHDVYETINNKLDEVVSNLEKIESAIHPKIRHFQKKIGVRPEPETLSEAVDDLLSDIKDSKIYDKFKDFLYAAVNLIKAFGKSGEDFDKAYVKFIKSATVLVDGITSAVGMNR